MHDETGIYAIENIRDRRVYVGATKHGFNHRWMADRSALMRGRSQVPQLQVDWDFYGSGWFKFIPLESLLPTTVWGTREQAWIDRLRAEGYVCYNRVTGTTDREKPWSNSLLLYPVYTLKEVATLFKITVPTVCLMVRQKKLSAFRLGRQWRVTRESIETYLQRQKDDANEPPPVKQ